MSAANLNKTLLKKTITPNYNVENPFTHSIYIFLGEVSVQMFAYFFYWFLFF
jgi:hypothetical protein